MTDNQRTVTIKMTKGQALRLCRLINNYVFSLEKDELKTSDRAADEWQNIHDKVRAGVDKLDQQDPEDEQTKMIRRMR